VKYQLVIPMHRVIMVTVTIICCLALSEELGGAAQGYLVVFGVIIGTGVGGGLVVDGRLLNGPHSVTDEWGHNPLPWVSVRKYARKSPLELQAENEFAG
jgi:predicted NBD/HSP70 family sugar kinase